MKLVVGLGNFGDKYKDNRHNVGFMVVDALASRMVNDQWSKADKLQSLIISHQPSILLAKPFTMMNNSGEAVLALTTYYKILPTDVYVIHDDLDIALGEYKVQKGVGPKLHNGILSVEEKLGKPGFWRIRIGVDNRSSDNRTPGEAYVLQDFLPEEHEIITRVVNKVYDQLK